MADLSWYDAESPQPAWVYWLLRHDRFSLYRWFGGRRSGLLVSFTLQDGTIWRESAGMGAAAAINPREPNSEFGKTLIVETKSRQRLRQTQADWADWIFGSDDDLAEHPYFKAGRPGGCKIYCEEAVVTYSTRAPLPPRLSVSLHSTSPA
jgi:hypothetical protein